MVVLVIIDGFGLAPPGPGNAIYLAKMPHWDRLWKQGPATRLEACGEQVGLPAGVMGNSEVGHLNLGAGRVVYQPLVLINQAVVDGSLARNAVIDRMMGQARQSGRIHLLGLVSDGGVHSHIDHLLALIELAGRKGIKPIVHAFLDGRDTPPRSAGPFLERVEVALGPVGGSIASLQGRYFGMDRDRRWERIEKGYEVLMGRSGFSAPSVSEGLERAYARGEDDEFVQPTLILAPGADPLTLKARDRVFFFNFRADRARQLTAALTQADFTGFERSGPLIHMATMMEYEPAYGLPHAFNKDRPTLTLGELVANAELKQFRCAETEKYAHVTYFLNGGREQPFPGEERRLIPSPRVATYDLQPEMSADEVARATASAVAGGKFKLVVVNFANADMVGHSGKLKPTIAAVEAVDRGLGRILEAAGARNEPCLVTSDHGNSDQVLTDEGQPHTYHTLNPVPCVLEPFETPWQGRKLRQPDDEAKAGPPPRLADVAPTLLELLGLEQPAEMTGRSLLV